MLQVLRRRILPPCFAVAVPELRGTGQPGPTEASGGGVRRVTKKLAETLGLLVAVCVGVKVAAGFVSAALPALIPIFVMALVAVVVMRWRNHL